MRVLPLAKLPAMREALDMKLRARGFIQCKAGYFPCAVAGCGRTAKEGPGFFIEMRVVATQRPVATFWFPSRGFTRKDLMDRQDDRQIGCEQSAFPANAAATQAPLLKLRSL
jgi:hypothetical protein